MNHCRERMMDPNCACRVPRCAHTSVAACLGFRRPLRLGIPTSKPLLRILSLSNKTPQPSFLSSLLALPFLPVQLESPYRLPTCLHYGARQRSGPSRANWLGRASALAAGERPTPWLPVRGLEVGSPARPASISAGGLSQRLRRHTRRRLYHGSRAASTRHRTSSEKTSG